MRLEQWIIDELVNKISPTGNWRDFNEHMRYYRWLLQLRQGGYLLESDLPQQPRPCDYHLDPPCS